MKNIAEIMYDDAALKGIPMGGTFELTPLCNMNCKMCYIRMSEKEMEKQGSLITADQWLSVAEDARKQGMLFLLLTGGEPFLYPEFWELYTELKKMGFFISINSNGTMLHGELAEKLIENPPYRINITVYGGSDKAYRELCGFEKGYSLATQAVKKLKESGVYVKLNSSITPFNCGDVDDCFAFAKSVKAPVELGTYMFPPMRRDNKYTGRFDPVSAGRYKAEIDKLRLEPEDYERVRKSIELCRQNGSSLDFKPKFRCRAGRSSFWINWKGEMTPCGMLELFKQNPFEDGFEECWKRINSEINSQTVLSECITCDKRDICRVCPAMAYAETGDFNKKPEYICEMTQAWADGIMDNAEDENK